MKSVAHSRYVRVTPQKARRIMNEVRGLPASRALDVLKFAPQKPAKPIRKTLVSALANAQQAARQAGQPFDVDTMFVVEAYVNDGPTMKRFRARAQGRGARILKRTSHLTLVVGDAEDKRELAAPWKKPPVVKKTAVKQAAKTSETAAKTKTAQAPSAKPASKESKPVAAKKKSGTTPSGTKAKAPKTTAKKTVTKKAPAKAAAKPNDAEKGAK